jgi:hypothetical protein
MAMLGCCNAEFDQAVGPLNQKLNKKVASEARQARRANSQGGGA